MEVVKNLLYVKHFRLLIDRNFFLQRVCNKLMKMPKRKQMLQFGSLCTMNYIFHNISELMTLFTKISFAFWVDLLFHNQGLHLAESACATAVVATHLGIPLTQIATYLSTFSAICMRSELYSC